MKPTMDVTGCVSYASGPLSRSKAAIRKSDRCPFSRVTSLPLLQNWNESTSLFARSYGSHRD